MQAYSRLCACRAMSLFCLSFLLASATLAQTTAFTYQGKLTDASNPANGVYDLQFRLFDALTGGNQVGATLIREDVQVMNGIFTTTLDFSGAAFTGASRFLEIAVRPGASTGVFTTLSPLQPITATPYAISAVNFSGNLAGDVTGTQTATVLANGAVTASKIATGQVVKSINALTDNVSFVAGNNITITPIGNTLSIAATMPPAILNQTTLQPNASFNIGGNGAISGTLSGGIVNSVTYYNLDGFKVLSNAGRDNVFVGVYAGFSNTFGQQNTFTGVAAGFFNTEGGANSFFGNKAGQANTSGSGNAFFGFAAGSQNTTGIQNAFFGQHSGLSNTTGTGNAFFGTQSGSGNSSGEFNAFFGLGAGHSNRTGNNNTYIGVNADGLDGLMNATAIGSNALVTQSDSLVLGSINSINPAAPDTKVGIGTAAPKARLDVTNGNILIGSPGQGLILKSPDGTKCTKLEIDNNGDLQINKLAACP